VLPCEKVDTGIVELVSSYLKLWSSAPRVRSALGFGVTAEGCRWMAVWLAVGETRLGDRLAVLMWKINC
jgi:hypothetical protein